MTRILYKSDRQKKGRPCDEIGFHKKQQNKEALMVNLLELYCAVDDFMKGFMPAYNKYLLTVGNKRRDRKS